MQRWTLFCLSVAVALLVLGASERVGQSTLHATEVGASDYYVDAVNGNDAAGNGSLGSPWRTITWALSHVSGPGAVVHVRPGLYNTALGESFPLWLAGGVSLMGDTRDTTIISGTANASVVQITNGSADILSDTVLSDLTLQYGSIGLYIYAPGGRTVGPTISNIRARYNGHGVQIESGQYLGAGVVNPFLNRVQARDNISAGFYVRAYAQGSVATPVISFCVSYHNGTYGVWIEGTGQGGYPGAASPVISDTLVANNGSHGVYLTASYEGQANPRLDRSMIEDNGGYGVYWTPDINGAHVNASLYDNFIVNNQQGGLGWGAYGYALASGNVRMVNNTIAANKNYGIYWNNGTGGVSSMSVINTIVWNPGADDLYATLAPGWTTAQIQYSDIEDGDFAGESGNFMADPLFVNTTGKDFHLGPGSPAVDRGTTALSDLTALDWDCESRVINGAVDVGADEAGPDFRSSAKFAPAMAAPGQVVTYTLIARNNGALSAANVRLTDTLPLSATFLPGSLSVSAGGTSVFGGVIAWIGTLSSGVPVTLTFAVTTSSSLPDSVLVNTAVITHPLLSAAQQLTATTALYRVNLYSSQKTVTPSRLTPGQVLTYMLVISNTGIDAAAARLTDTLPSALTYVPGSLAFNGESAGVSGQTVTWTGTLAPGAVARVRFRALAATTLPDNATLTNTATLADGIHATFDVAAPPVVVSRYKIFLPATLKNWPPCRDYISNGGFESGPPGTPWVQYSNGGFQLVNAEGRRTGSWGVLLAGYNNANEWIYQTVSIPAGSQASLSYYWAMGTQETTSAAFDHLYVRIKNTGGSTLRTVQSLSNGSTPNQWVGQSFDVSEFAGQTVRVEFAGTNDTAYPTIFGLDDVSLWTCGANVPPAVTSDTTTTFAANGSTDFSGPDFTWNHRGVEGNPMETER